MTFYPPGTPFYVFDAIDRKHRRAGLVEVTVSRLGYRDACCRVKALTDLINWPLIESTGKMMYWHAAGDEFEVLRGQLKEIVY